jgi:quercetin dioxygenase-like cupin family protein
VTRLAKDEARQEDATNKSAYPLPVWGVRDGKFTSHFDFPLPSCAALAEDIRAELEDGSRRAAPGAGDFSIVERPIDPGRMVHPHVHPHEDEFSYILEGEIGARVGDEVLQATIGSYVFKPRGLPHTFWNATTKPARLLELISPAGFEKYLGKLLLPSVAQWR